MTIIQWIDRALRTPLRWPLVWRSTLDIERGRNLFLWTKLNEARMEIRSRETAK